MTPGFEKALRLLAGAGAGMASRRHMLLYLAVLGAWPGSARAAPQAGDPSTAAVRIQLSVAPRLDLRAMNQAKDPSAAGYCILSNTGRPALPVHLLRPAIEPADDGGLSASSRKTAISWCGGGISEATAPAGPQETGLVLISPE
ncbi:MAG: hypothetical protein ACREB1_10920 [Sphingomicrobium sp.]